MPSFVKFRHSLSRRFSLAIIGVITVIVAGFAIVLIQYRIHTSQTELQERLSVMSKLAEMSLPAPLWFYNYEFLENFLKALLSDNTIACANIIAQDEIVISETGPNIPQKEWAFFEESKDFITQITEIQYEGDTIGAIQIAVSQANLQHEVLVSIVSTIVLAVLLILAISVTSILVTQRYITRPLSSMVQMATLISHGELDERLEVLGHLEASQDELGLLTRGFQRMILYLQDMVTMANQIALGDLQQEVHPRTTSDVLGNAFQRMLSYLKDIGNIATHVAQGDLRTQVEVRSPEDRLGTSFVCMREGLIELISKIRIGSNDTSSISSRVLDISSKNATALGQISKTAQETSAAIQYVDKRSEEIRANMESLHSAIDETSTFIRQMNTSITQVAENSNHASQLGEETTNTVEELSHSLKQVSQQAEYSRILSETTTKDSLFGQKSVEQVTASMQTISDVTENISTTILRLTSHSSEISTILDVINEIAEQTSLLALNASIIAAQAGSHGKGFAVVATEIQALAMRVRSSTNDISRIVKTVQTETANAVEAIQQGQREVKKGVVVAHNAGDALDKIKHSAEDSAQVAHEIAVLVGQHTTTYTGIAEAMRDISSMIHTINQAIHGQNSKTSELLEIMENMQGLQKHVLKATHEQQENAYHVTTLMRDVLFLVEENAPTVKELANSAKELATQAHTLKEHVERFSIPGDQRNGIL